MKYKFKLTKQFANYTPMNDLFGGSLEIANINEITISDKLNELQSNKGQHNCGIIIMDNYVVKCLSISVNNNINHHQLHKKAVQINAELDNLFVKYYKWPNEQFINPIQIIDKSNSTKYAHCIIMEKLDGDLTDYILKNSFFKAYNNYNDYDFFYSRLPKTNGQYINDLILNSDSEEVKITKKFNNDKMNLIKKNLQKYIFEICQSLNTDIIFLHHQLIKKGWNYYDLKLDNLAWKNENGKIIFKFIDEESGLTKFKYNNINDYLDLHCFTTHLGNYSIFGQYNLKYIFQIDFANFVPKFNLELKQNIKNMLLSNEYDFLIENNVFNWMKFKKQNLNNFFIIQFVMGFYRLIIYDDYEHHISNSKFNFPKIDELFYSIDGLYEKLNELYQTNLY